MSYKQAIITYITGLGRRNGHANPDKTNTGSIMAEVFQWQTAHQIVEARLKAAKERLREVIKEPPTKPGIAILGESPMFTAMATVKKGAQRFDRDVFIDAVIERWPEIKRHELVEIAAASIKVAAPATTITIVERGGQE